VQTLFGAPVLSMHRCLYGRKNSGGAVALSL